MTTLLALLVGLSVGTGCRTSQRQFSQRPPVRPIADGHFEEFERHAPAPPPPAEDQRLRERWDLWADSNLQTGDVVFRRESWRVAGGAWDVTKFISKLADSNFSHVGFVVVEDGHAYVYDTTRVVGPRRVRFHEFLFAGGMNFGIKRPRAEVQPHVPAALAFVKKVYADRVPFDPDFDHGPETIYCTEMIELAYRSAGVELSSRRAYEDFPRWKDFPIQTAVAERATGWSPQHAVFAPGNADFGLWSSQALELVLVARSPYDPEVVSRLPPAPAPPRGFGRMPHAESDGPSYLRFGL